MRSALLFALALALLAFLCVGAFAGGCDWACKIRIHACDKAAPARCWAEDKLPEQTGLCPIMMMGVTGEWIAKHPGAVFKAAECVAPDDERI